MHSFHLSAALSPFECSSPTPRCKSTAYHGDRPNRRNNQSLKQFTFSAKGWDRNNVQLQTVQHPKLAATRTEFCSQNPEWAEDFIISEETKVLQVREERRKCKVTVTSAGTAWCSDGDYDGCAAQPISADPLPFPVGGSWALSQSWHVSWHLWLGWSRTRALRSLHPCSGCCMGSGSAGEMPSKLQFSSKKKSTLDKHLIFLMQELSLMRKH